MEPIIRRKCHPKTEANFISLLQEVSWNRVLEENNTENTYSLFIKKFSEIYNEAFPKYIVKCRYDNRKPWLTDGLRKAIKHKNKLYKKTKKIPVTHIIVEYKQYKNKLNKLLKESERMYYQDMFENYRGNMKQTWNVIKRILNKNKKSITMNTIQHAGKTVTDSTEIANVFNNFFTNVGTDLAKKISFTNKLPSSFLKDKIYNSMVLEQVTPDELDKIIHGLKNSAVGHDEVDACHLKAAYQFINIPLLHICNQSFLQGIFPKWSEDSQSNSIIQGRGFNEG